MIQVYERLALCAGRGLLHGRSWNRTITGRGFMCSIRGGGGDDGGSSPLLGWEDVLPQLDWEDVEPYEGGSGAEGESDGGEAKEGDLDTAYETAGNAHTRVMNILTQINLVNDAQVLYDQYLGMTTGGGNGFNEALKVLKDTSNGFNNPLADHTSTSSDLQAVPSNLQQLVDDVNTKALAARNQHTALVGAKTASVNSGLCQQSGGGVNEECTSSHLDRAGGARLAAIDADAAVVTAKVHVWACH